jgi:uncharacterized protein with NAD-binding domain and iron-sulfur cluster
MTEPVSEPKPSVPYIERGGEQSFLQPYDLRGTNFYGFMLEGSLSHLQTLCDRQLNEPAQGAVTYRAISPYVVLSFDSVRAINSTLEPDRSKGTFSEHGEVIVWTLVAAGKQKNNVFIAERLAVFIPYIFVNNSPALVSGREVYGFPKEWGWIEMPANLAKPEHFNLETVGWQTFAPDAEGVRQQLLEINIDENQGCVGEAIADLEAFTRLLKNVAFPDCENITIPGIELPCNLLKDLKNLAVPMVFLKQFRDATDGKNACYQAIVEANSEVIGFEGGKILGDRYNIHINNLASHPIAQDLGLKQNPQLPTGTFQPCVAFRVQFDFSLKQGKTVYQATPKSNRNFPMKKQKIAVLGGGLGAMTTVFELTEQPNWQEYYDITVYQLGWRLGGKGASGRNMQKYLPHEEPDYRIQEHGFHIFFGFYENAFRLMDRCYQASGDDGPFDTVADAFKPHNFVVLQEFINDQWVPWYINYPANKLVPWQDTNVRSIWEYIETALQFALELYTNSPALQGNVPAENPPANLFEYLQQQLERSFDFLLRLPEIVGVTLEGIDLTIDSALLVLAGRLVQALPNQCQGRAKELYQVIVSVLETFQGLSRKALERAIAKEDIETRRLLIVIDFINTVIRGLIIDDALDHQSFNDLDNYDFAAWLTKHGAWDITVESALVRAMYDLLFGFVGGENTQANQSLGTAAALRWAIRMNLGYNGAIMWKMQAGMGDTIFAPMYEVLKRRGVNFKFFHRVDNLGLDPMGGDRINEITLYKQVNLKNPDQDYDPIVKVKRLSCWPAEPLYDQINETEAQQLQANNIDLECFWTKWPEIHQEEKISLKLGEDFDLVVLGISLGSFPFVCPELIAAKPQWQQMVDNIKTVSTQGGQLWMKSTLAQLGWDRQSPVLGTYVEPLDTYADMTHLLEKENWSSANYPYNIAYFTGTMPDPGIPVPINEHYDFPAQQQALVEASAIQFLENSTGYLWPKGTSPQNPDGLDWNLLVDPQNREGVARFQSQYWRVNISPSERYVMSVPESQKFRLDAGNSGFANLYLTGDWINNSLNSGCAEATVMAGMQCADALLKQEFKLSGVHRIFGESKSWL